LGGRHQRTRRRFCRVGPHHHRSADQVGVVAGSVTGRQLDGELLDTIVEDLQQVQASLTAASTRPQTSGEGFAGGVGETEQRMEPAPALEMRRSTVFILRVDLDQRRIDIQNHRPIATSGRGSLPYPVPDPSQVVDHMDQRLDDRYVWAVPSTPCSHAPTVAAASTCQHRSSSRTSRSNKPPKATSPFRRAPRARSSPCSLATAARSPLRTSIGHHRSSDDRVRSLA
jgi:hypothetical protein